MKIIQFHALFSDELLPGLSVLDLFAFLLMQGLLDFSVVYIQETDGF